MAEIDADSGGADEDVDMDNKINPFDIDLVLDLLLDFLEPRNLRKCRLVSQRWNSFIVNKLRARPGREYAVPIDSSNIFEYATMAKRSVLSPESMLPVSLSIQPKRDEDGNELDKFIVNELVDRLGEQFVQHLTCTSAKTVEDWGNVFELIHLLSPGLKTLWLSEGPFKQSITHTNLKAVDLYLPTLTSITYFEVLKNPTLLIELVNSTCQLKELVIIIHSMESIKGEFYRNRSTVLSKALNEIEPVKLTHLTKLVIPMDEEVTYKSLGQIRFPELRQLKLSMKRNASDASARILSHFLASNCPNLTSLEFTFLICKREVEYPMLGFPNGNEFSEFPKHMPRLPNLTHFGYEYDEFPAATSTPSFVRADHLNPTCFPNLTSVAVPYGTFLYSSSGFQDPDLDLDSVDWLNNPALIGNVCFHSVTKLTLIINSSLRFGIHFRTPKLNLEEACNQLHLLFPSVNELNVDMHIVPLASEMCFQKANEFLACLLQEMAPIRKLHLSNYFHSQREFVQFLSDNPGAVNALRSLEEFGVAHNSKHAATISGRRTRTCQPIRVSQTRRRSIESKDFQLLHAEPMRDATRDTVVNTLEQLVSNLPQLKELKMDGICLTNHCVLKERPEIIVSKIQDMFPTLNIQLC